MFLFTSLVIIFCCMLKVKRWGPICYRSKRAMKCDHTIQIHAWIHVHGLLQTSAPPLIFNRFVCPHTDIINFSTYHYAHSTKTICSLANSSPWGSPWGNSKNASSRQIFNIVACISTGSVEPALQATRGHVFLHSCVVKTPQLKKCLVCYII